MDNGAWAGPWEHDFEIIRGSEAVADIPLLVKERQEAGWELVSFSPTGYVPSFKTFRVPAPPSKSLKSGELKAGLHTEKLTVLEAAGWVLAWKRPKHVGAIHNDLREAASGDV